MTAGSLLCFSGSFNHQPLISPLYPLVCAILPWSQTAGQFPFPCIFLTGSLLAALVSRVEKQFAGWQKTSFSHIWVFATQNASTAHLKGSFGVAELQNYYTKQSTFFESLYNGFLSSGFHMDASIILLPQ